MDNDSVSAASVHPAMGEERVISSGVLFVKVYVIKSFQIFDTISFMKCDNSTMKLKNSTLFILFFV